MNALFTRRARALPELRFDEVMSLSRRDPGKAYAYCREYFQYRAPQLLRDHRHYFKQEHRGFGEDAFHSMWWLLAVHERPTRFVEIGVYRGQVLSLWCMLSDLLGLSADVVGISPFTPAGDSVSNYLAGLDYMADVEANTRTWSAMTPTLHRAYSTDSSAVALLKAAPRDVIYVDGSHEEDVVRADVAVCLEALRPGGLLVLDDASSWITWRRPRGSFPGHPGPSAVAEDLAVNGRGFTFLGSVGHNVIFGRQ